MEGRKEKSGDEGLQERKGRMKQGEVEMWKQIREGGREMKRLEEKEAKKGRGGKQGSKGEKKEGRRKEEREKEGQMRRQQGGKKEKKKRGETKQAWKERFG